MNSYDTIIIGGGLGGLVAGALLAKKGKKILLLEQHYIPGGCATTFKRKDFVMEVGLHEMDGLHPTDPKTKLFKKLGIFDAIELIRVPEFYRAIDDNYDITIPDDTKKAIEVLSEKFPDEIKGIRKYFKIIHKIQREIELLPKKQWKTLLLFPIFPVLYPYLSVSSHSNTNFLNFLNPFFLLLKFNLVFWKHTTIGSLLDSCIKNNNLKKVLLSNLPYYHNDPYSMSLVSYSAAQGNYYRGGYFIKGGSQELSNYLSSVITNNNGIVLLGKKVKKIIVHKKRATGVIYKDAFNHNLSEVSVFSETVIANAAIPLVAPMLPKKHGNYIKNKINALEKACSLLSIYIGFKTEVKNLGHHHYSTFVSGKNIKTIRDIEPNSRDRWENRGFVFVDYSQIDAGLAPKGKSFGTICTIDYLSDWEFLDADNYKDKKEEVAQIFFKRLEKVIPGITQQIEYYEVGTSKTIRRFTSNPEGTPYGFAQTPKQAGIHRQKSLVNIKNLFFASAWGFPGGGFTGAILSGMNVAKVVKKKLRYSSQKSIDYKEDQRIVPLISNKEIAENTLELCFEKPNNFHYIAGQYALLDLMKTKYNSLDMSIRMLSMVSHPNEQTLRFAMRLSKSYFKQTARKLKNGEKCRIFGPMGEFTLSEKEKGIVFLVSGIGITPIISLLKELDVNTYNQPIYLFYSNKSIETTAYHGYLNSIKNTQFSYIPVFTNTQRRINKTLLIKTLQSFIELDFYTVGGNSFVKSMMSILISMGIKKERIKIDDFG